MQLENLDRMHEGVMWEPKSKYLQVDWERRPEFGYHWTTSELTISSPLLFSILNAMQSKTQTLNSEVKAPGEALSFSLKEQCVQSSVEISHLLTPLFCSLTPQTLGSLMVAAVTAGVTGTSRGLKLWVKGTSPTSRIVIPKGWSKPLLFLFSFLSCLLVPDTSSQGNVWHNNF